MDDIRWKLLVDHIQGEDIVLMVEASECLIKEATLDDVPRLLELLNHKNFVVREAAAWPLACIGGPDFLPQLFSAFQCGYDEGLDNDGLQTALIELVMLHPQAARQKLEDLQVSNDSVNSKYATWLLEFC